MIEPGPSGRHTDAVVVNQSDVVLIVDDEPLIRRVLRQTLEIADYTVLEASDGVEAIAMLEAHEHRVAAVVSDITMPRMDGLVLAERLATAHPAVPVVLASGMHVAATIPHPIASRITAFIEKPYSRETVLDAVAAAISRDAAA